MPKLFDITSVGACALIRARDEHCPPHIHAINKSKGWEIKLNFPYADNDPDAYQFKILAGSPKITDVNQMLQELVMKEIFCREKWWGLINDVCLINKSVSISDQGVLGMSKNGKKVVHATYDPKKDTVIFLDQGSSVLKVGKCP